MFYFFVWVLHFVIFSAFFKLRLEGKENIPKKGRFILAANHQNFFDGYLLSYATGPFKKINFVIAKRALKLKFFQIIAKLIGSELIGNDFDEYQIVLKRLNRVLSHGGHVGIFPEGDISKNTIPKKFKGGVAKLSLDSKTKVIPVFLSGTYNLRYSKYWLKRSEISIIFGKPIELYNHATACGHNLDQMASILREKIIEVMKPKERTDSSSPCQASSVYVEAFCGTPATAKSAEQ